jgi:hypothetical protein
MGTGTNKEVKKKERGRKRDKLRDREKGESGRYGGDIQ